MEKTNIKLCQKFIKKILIVGLDTGLTLGLALANRGLKIWGYDKNKLIIKLY